MALVSSGRSDLLSSAETKLDLPKAAPAVDRLDRARAAAGRGLLEGRAAHGDDLLGVLRADRGDGVAGIDRPGEGVLALDRENVGNLHHVELGGDARGDVLAGGGGGREEGVVVGHQRGGNRRDVFGQLMLEVRAVGDMDLADAGDLAGGIGHRANARSGHQQMDFAQLRRGGHRGQGRVLDLLAVMLDQNQSLHLATPSAFSFATSSSTEPTFTPALRLAGSSP